jgi:flagellar biosynthesis chaperone FliJ
MDDAELEQLVRELTEIPDQIAAHRDAISELAARRRALAEQLRDAIGPTLAAKRLGVSRQTFWQVLNPAQAKEIKRRSRTGAARRTQNGPSPEVGDGPPQESAPQS